MTKKISDTGPAFSETAPTTNGLTRREMLQKGYSSAMVALLMGGTAALTSSGGCNDEDEDEQSDSTTTKCDNTCEYATDGACDDGGEGSEYNVCELGSDCDDCGTRYNVTEYSDTSYSESAYSDSAYSDSYSEYDDYYEYYDYYSIYSEYFSNSW